MPAPDYAAHLLDIAHWYLGVTEPSRIAAAVYGWFVAPIGWRYAIIVWAYAGAWFLFNSLAKILAYRVLDYRAAHQARHLKLVEGKLGAPV